MLTPTTPGQWQAQLPRGQDGVWRIEALDADGQALATHRWATPPTIEHTHRTPNTDQIDALNIEADDSAFSSSNSTLLWPWLLLLAGLLLPVDAFARRHTR